LRATGRTRSTPGGPGRLAAVVLLLGAVQGCAVLDLLSPSRQRGLASWYGPGFYGEATAGGTVYTGGGMTAAHPRFPFGTRVRVTNLENGRRVVVVIDDRGPFVRGRIIDLSEAAALALGMVDAGVVRVRLKVLEWGSGET
jgi:peptidoglycan lytic transglycosylase